MAEVTAGANVVDADNSQATPITGSGAAPAFAIDVAQLGGMYAGKIVLVGTEAGVGVRNAGYLGASAGEVVVTADGRLTNSGSLLATANVELATQGMNNSGKIGAQHNVVIRNRDDLDNTGAIVGAHELILATTGKLTNDGGTLEAQRLDLDAGTLDNLRGKIRQTGSQALTIDTRTIANRNDGVIGRVPLTTSGTGESSGTGGSGSGSTGGGGSTTGTTTGTTVIPATPVLLADGRIAIRGTITNDGGEIVANGGTALVSHAGFDNRARIDVDQLTTRGSFGNAGGKIVAQRADIGTERLDNNGGDIVIRERLDLNAREFTNRGGSLQLAGSTDLAVRLAGDLDNTAGRIAVNGANLTLTAATLSNTDGRIEHAGDGTLELTAATLAGTRGTIVGNGALALSAQTATLDSGSTVARALTIDAGTLSNQGGRIAQTGDGEAAVRVAGRLDNRGGTLAGNGDLTLTAGSLANDGGRIEAVGRLQAGVVGEVGNAAGSVVAGQDLALAAASVNNASGTLGTVAGALTATVGGTLDNSAGRIEAAKDLTLASGKLVNAGGTVVGDGVSIDTRGQALGSALLSLDNSRGRIVAAAAMNLQTGALSNDAGLIQAGGALTVDTHGQALTNTNADSTGGILGQGSVTLTVGSLDNAAGRITATQDLRVTAAQDIDNAVGLIAAGHDLTLAAASLDNAGGTLGTASGRLAARIARIAGAAGNAAGRIEAGNGLDLATASLDNARGEIVQTGSGGTTLAVGGTLDNGSGLIATNGHGLVLTAGTLANTDGRIEHAGSGTLALTAGTLTGTRGGIASNGTLALSAQSATLDGGSTIAKALAIDAGTLSNQGGRIAQTGDGEAAVRVAGHLDNRGGTLAGNGDLTLAAGSLDNAGGRLSTVGKLQATVSGEVGNAAGAVVAGQDLVLAAASVNNAGGTLGAVVGALTATVGGTLDNSAGRIEAAKDLTLASGKLVNAGGTVVGDGVGIDTHSQALGSTLLSLDNSRGRIVAAAAMNLQTGALSNDAGLIQAGGALTVDTHGQALANTNAGTTGGILGQGSVTLAVGDLDNAAGFLGAKGALAVRGRTLANTAAGHIVSETDIALAADRLDNQGGQVEAAGALGIAAADIVDNRGGLLRAGAALTVGTASLVNTDTLGAGQGIEGRSLAVTATAIGSALPSVDNRSGALRADTALTLQSSGTVDNSGGLISSAETVVVRDPAATKTLAVTNTAGTIIAGRQLDIDSASLSGGGRLLSLGDLDVKLVADYTHTGELTADGRARFTTAGTLTNQSKMQAGTSLALTAATIDNQAAGQLLAPELRLAATATLTNRGLIDGGDARLDAITLNNLGSGRIYGDHLAISATTLNNSAEGGNSPVIAARGRLDLGATTLANREGALIFSTGDLAIGGSLDANNRATGRAGTVTNASATIEALVGLTLDAALIDNRNEHFSTQLVTVGSIGIDEWLRTGSATRYRPDQVTLTWTSRPGVVYRPPASGGMDYMGGQGFFSDNSNNNVYLNTPSGSASNFWLYSYTRTTQETQVLTSSPGKILAGGDMRLAADTLRNDNSQILAGGNLVGSFGAVDNVATAGQRIETDSGTAWNVYPDKKHGDSDRNSYGYNSAATVTAISLSAARFEGNTAIGGSGSTPAALAISNVGQTAAGAGAANAAVSGPGGAVGSGVAVGREGAGGIGPVAGHGVTGTASAAVPRITRVSPPAASGVADVIATVSTLGALPNNRLYRANPDPAGRYLRETDPAFASYAPKEVPLWDRQWLSSDYMLQQLALNPATSQKRLGDGFYEQRLITEQVGQLTGRRFLVGYQNDEAQYRALLNAGAAYAKEWHLVPGVALSAAQMAALTTDMVWLVEQEVTLADGSRQKALVPQLYARVQPGDLAPTGGLFADQALALDVTGNVTNFGTLAGRQLVSLSAENLDNLGGRIAGNDIALAARQDLRNLGGVIEAGDRLAAVAGGDLTVASTTRTANGRTNLDRVAGLYVQNPGGTLSLAAGGDIALLAAYLINNAPTAAGVPAGKTVIDAGHNLTLGTVSTAYSEAVGDGKHARRDAYQNEVGTTITTAGDLTLAAGSNLTLRAASLAAGGSLAAQAGDQLVLSTAEERTRSDSGGGRNTRSEATASERGSVLQAEGDLRLSAGADLVARAAAVGAGGDLFASAGRDFRIEAGEAARHVEQASYRKSGKKKTTTFDTFDATTALASAFSGENVTLAAARDLTVTGSSVAATQAATLGAGRNLTLEAATETQRETHFVQTKKKGSFSKKSKTSRDAVEDATAVASTVVGESVTLVAGQDLAVTGSKVAATLDTTLVADRDLAIEAATETHRETHFVQKKKSGLSGSLANGVSVGKSSSTQSDKMAGTTAAGSAIGGDNILLSAGRDASVSGSQVIADRNLDVVAGRDANILAAQNTRSEEHSFKSKSSRLIVVRQSVRRKTAPGKSLSLFADDPDIQGWRYGSFATTLDLPAAEVWRLYRGRADCENRIKELKADFGLDAFNMRDFWATEAALSFAMLAYNLMSLFRQAVLRSRIQHTLSTLHGLVLAVGGAWHKDAGQQRLMLSVPRRKRAWFAGLWANASTPPVIPGLARG